MHSLTSCGNLKDIFFLLLSLSPSPLTAKRADTLSDDTNHGPRRPVYVCAVLYVQTGGRIRRTKQVQRDRRQVSWRCLGRIGSLQKLNQTEPRNKKIVELPPNFVTFGGVVK